MTLTVNGDPFHTDAPHLTVAELLVALGLADATVAVAVNLSFVPRSTHPSHPLHEGDSIEIVAPMQGG